MPSAADLIFIAILCTLTFTAMSVRLLGDAGIGWHIRTGQQILATHAIPRVDSFSSTMSGKPWFAWEWLYDVIVGHLEAAMGLNGVTWFTAIVIGAVFAWMFRLLIARGTHLLAALGLVLLALAASMIHFLARPHVVSWLFTLAWFWILDSTECDSVRESGRRPSRLLWTLPVMMLVWVNVHGGFLIGFVLLAIFWSGSVWRWITTREDRIEQSIDKINAGKRTREVALVALVCAAASLVNPYGWKLHAHIYSYLSNRFLMDHIEEFQSPNFHGVAEKCFLALLLLSVAVVMVRGRELRWSGAWTLLFALASGMYASRNIPVSSILLGMVVGPLLSTQHLPRNFFKRMGAVESALRGHFWPMAASLVTLLIAAHGGWVRSSHWMDAHFGSTRMPVSAVSYLKNRTLIGPILSPDHWGGYLIYTLYPDAQVVVDDRHDLYGAEFLKSYLRMMHGEQGWDDFLQQYNPGCVLLPRNATLASLLSNDVRWKTVYSDDVSIIFVRTGVNPEDP
jgi:hypothetical protein